MLLEYVSSAFIVGLFPSTQGLCISKSVLFSGSSDTRLLLPGTPVIVGLFCVCGKSLSFILGLFCACRNTVQCYTTNQPPTIIPDPTCVYLPPPDPAPSPSLFLSLSLLIQGSSSATFRILSGRREGVQNRTGRLLPGSPSRPWPVRFTLVSAPKERERGQRERERERERESERAREPERERARQKERDSERMCVCACM